MLESIGYWLGIVGGVFVVYWSLRAAFRCYLLFFAKVDLERYRNGYSWAVVTGCTDGIGRALCVELAAHGFSLILVSRTEEKLQAMRDELRLKFPKLDFSYVVSEASDLAAANFDGIVDATKDKNVTILANNVGRAKSCSYSVETADEVKLIISVNCTYSAILTKALLPTLRKNGRALIVNVSSILAFLSSPYIASYSATKAFVSALSKSLAIELAPYVDVANVMPGLVESKMSGHKRDLICCSAKECAEGILNQVGKTQDIYPHWKHFAATAAVFVQILPVSVRKMLSDSFFRKRTPQK